MLGIVVIAALALEGCASDDASGWCGYFNSPNIDDIENSAIEEILRVIFGCAPPPANPCPTYPYCYGAVRERSRNLLFEANNGQAPHPARFVAQNRAFAFLLEERGAELAPRQGRAGAVRLRFEGALESSRVEGVDPQPGIVNYLIGNDPKRWRTGIRTYDKVLQRGVYDGIDVLYYGRGEQIENDFILHAGARPENIRIGVEGARRMEVNRYGDLVIHTADGALTWHRPNVYQKKRKKLLAIENRYVLLDSTHVGFRLGAYDAKLPVVIDPILAYSTLVGSSGNDSGKQVAVDAAGNVYVTGYTTSAKLPVTSGAAQPAPGGVTPGATLSTGDAFVMKFAAGTNQLVYLTYLGGSRSDVGLGIAVDAGGNAYVSGMTESQDFPTTAGAYQRQSGSMPNADFIGTGDAFVAKLSADGSQLIYSTYLGGNQRDGAWAIAVDSGGNAYVTGQTLSSNFPTTASALQNSFHWAGSKVNLAGLAFVSKINPTGSSLIYSTFLGGTGDNRGLAIAVDAAGDAYVTGSTTSVNFPVTMGSLQTRFAGSNAQHAFFGDAFVAKLNPAGSALVYATYLGGTGEDVGMGIAVDSAGFAYLTGMTLSRNFPVTPGASQATFGGTASTNPIQAGDAFVAKINPGGTALVYATYLGGSSDDAAVAVAINAAGEAAVTGFTLSKDFPVTRDASQSKYAGEGGQFFMQTGDAFVAKLNASGSALLYSTYLGGSGDDAGLGIAADASGVIYVTGATVSPDFPTSMGALQSRYGGAEGGKGMPRGDIFVVRLGDAVVTPPAAKPVPAITGVRSASEFGALPRAAPGSWIEIYGTNLAADSRLWASSDFNGAQAPTALDGTSVMVGGKAAVVSAISPNQVNAQAPLDLTPGNQQVTVTNANGTSAPYGLTVDTVAPGLYAPARLMIGGKQYVQALTSDGSYVLPAGSLAGVTSRPARPGETIVMVGVGFGSVSPAAGAGQVVGQPNQLTSSIQVLFGQTPASLAYAGLAPQTIGLYQFNVLVPMVEDSDAVPLTFTAGGVAGSQTLYTAVHQ